MFRTLTLVAAFVLLPGCLFGGNDDTGETTDADTQATTEAAECAGPRDCEGDDAGECSDGVDNDQNGQVDCSDARCAQSLDCVVEPGLDEEDFLPEFIDVICRLSAECLEVQDYDECIDSNSEGADQCIDYDRLAAEDCLEGTRDVYEECPADFADFTFPTACERVCAETDN